MLDIDLYSRYLPDMQTYQADYRAAGFSISSIEDMSDDWQQFTSERHANFVRDRARQEEMHGADVATSLDRFYGTVAALFSGGTLGGIRISASMTR